MFLFIIGAISGVAGTFFFSEQMKIFNSRKRHCHFCFESLRGKSHELIEIEGKSKKVHRKCAQLWRKQQRTPSVAGEQSCPSC